MAHKESLKLSFSFYLFLLFLLLILFIAYIHNNNIAFLILFFSIYFLVVGLLWAKRNLQKVSVQFVDSEKFFANHKARALFAVRSHDISYDIHISRYVFAILKKELVWIEFVFDTRGVVKRVELVIESFFPFGLFVYKKSVEVDVDIVVFPEPKGKSLQQFLQSTKEFKEEFEGLRRYQESDSIKDIFWPSVAKGEVQSKKFSSSTAQLLFDYDALQMPKEQKLSQITLWVLQAHKEGLMYKVRLGGKLYPSSKGIYEILTILACY